MSLIQVSGLTFGYDGSYENVFENVSFQLDTDWRLGLTGRNGRGKTTLLRLLAGELPYGGSITADAVFRRFPCETPDPSHPALELLEELCPGAREWELLRELSRLGVPEEALYRPFETLSGGEKTKALLAALFLQEHGFPLIDEPTDHLDLEARRLTARYLRSKQGFILVSHDRAFLDECVDHILSINRAGIQVQRGNFSSWLQNKELEDRFELEQNARLKKEIGRLQETARDKADWSDRVEAGKIGTHQADRGRVGHLAAKAMKRSKSIETRVEREIGERSKLLKNLEKSDALTLRPLQYHAPRLLELRDVTIRYGEKTVCGPVSFSLLRGERVALRGRNGSGKTSLLRLILGEEIPHTGEALIPGGLIFSSMEQEAGGMSGTLPEFEDRFGLDKTLFRAILRKLDFSRSQFDLDLSDYSAGQKKKILLAKSLCRPAHLYIWDEPLNYIDVLSRMQIENLILTFQPTMLFVEHDRTFCDKTATRVIELT